MEKFVLPELKQLSAAKQRRMDHLLEKNSEGTITLSEKAKLTKLVAEAEQLMVENANLHFASGSRRNQHVLE